MFPLTYQLAQVLSLLLAGLTALKRQVSGDIALLGGRILDPAFLLPIAQESYMASTIKNDAFGTPLSTCTDLSTIIQTTELQPYYGFTPWPGYKDYLDPGPGLDDVVDDASYYPIVETPSKTLAETPSKTRVYSVNKNVGSQTPALFNNDNYTLPANIATNTNNTSSYASDPLSYFDWLSLPFKFLRLSSTNANFLALSNSSGTSGDALNDMSISKRSTLPGKDSSSVLAHTTTRTTVSNDILASQPGRRMQGGLADEFEYPSGFALCVITVLYVLCRFTYKLMVVYMHTAGMRSSAPSFGAIVYTHTAKIRSFAASFVVNGYKRTAEIGASAASFAVIVLGCFVRSCSLSRLVISFLLARRRILAPKLRSAVLRLVLLSLSLIMKAIVYYIEATALPTGVPPPPAVNIRRWRLKRTKCGSVKKKGARKARAAAAASADASAPVPVVAAQEQVVQPVAPVAANKAVDRVPAGFVPATKTVARKKVVIRRANISGPRLFK